MNKKLGIVSLSIVLAVLIFLIIVGKVVCSFFFTTGFDITFVNRTDNQIEGLYITYGNITNDIEVPSISKNSSFKININPSENLDETSMKLYYFDKNNNKNEETIIGYFERGYSGKVAVEIQDTDENGKHKFKVNENIW